MSSLLHLKKSLILVGMLKMCVFFGGPTSHAAKLETASQSLKTLPRWNEVRDQRSAPPLYPVTPLDYKGNYLKGYYFTDIQEKIMEGPKVNGLLAALRYIDQWVIPRFAELFDLKIEYPTKKPLIVVFDSQLSAPALHQFYLDPSTRERRSFLVFDINPLFLEMSEINFPHEVQHYFRSQFNHSTKDHWLTEGLSVFASELMSEGVLKSYLMQNPSFHNHPLFYHQFDQTTGEYFRAFFFIYYLYKHYGGLPLIRSLLKNPNAGVENIDQTLMSFGKKSSFSKYYNFKKAFINFSLALILNPYRHQIESADFFNLMIQEEYSTQTESMPDPTDWLSPQIQLLTPVTSLYYELTSLCVSAEYNQSSWLSIYFIDIYAHDQQVQIMEQNKKYCVKELKGTGQYVVLINPDPDQSEPYKLHRH